MMASLLSERQWTLEWAMREWARTDPVVPESVRATDHLVLKAVIDLLETTGRKSGQPRTTPLGGRHIGAAFWFVSEFGDRSQYVRNIMADPNVRVRLNGRWHRGTAVLLPDDDARARMRDLPQYNTSECALSARTCSRFAST